MAPTAPYTAAAGAFSRRVQWLVEIDLDRCSLDFGAGACTAAGADGARCYYSYQTCQDVTNYNAATNTLRFCLNDVPWPDTAYAVHPYLQKFVPVPQRIDPAKLYVFPEKVTVNMLCDWTPMAPDLDKTTHNTRTTGEFWRNLVARNRNYPGKALRIKRGFYTSSFTLADFLQIGPEYKIKEIQVKGETCSITAESPLADLNKKEVPWSISDDNTVQTEINAAVVEVVVRDADEYPDPADYTLNTIYVRMGTEICKVESINTATDTLTIVRGSLYTTAAVQAVDTKVEHVAFFGTDNGISTAPSAANIIDVARQLMEWAGIAAGSIDTDTFDDIKAVELTGTDTYRLVTKPAKVSKHLQPIREIRGILIFIDADGKWSCRVMGPDDSATLYDEDTLLEDSISVTEDEENRITRVSLWYSPNIDNPKDDPADYDINVSVIDSTLENANNFGGSKVRDVFDPWIYPSAAVSTVRDLARRLITRLRYGVRLIKYRLDVKHGALNVGGSATLQSRHVLDAAGAQEARFCVVTARREISLSQNEYEATDINYNGPYLRIAPDTVGADYDSGTAEDRSYGTWGDSDNRVGTVSVPGSIFW